MHIFLTDMITESINKMLREKAIKRLDINIADNYAAERKKIQDNSLTPKTREEICLKDSQHSPG